MVNYSMVELDDVFIALANSQRRELISFLRNSPRSMSELAERLRMSLPALYKHVKILERAKLVVSRKQGRVNTIILQPMALLSAEEWIDHHKAYWNDQLDTLEQYVNTIKRNENGND